MKKKCDSCGGSGQIGCFQGESRFIITWDECPECIGTGFIETDDKPQVEIKKKVNKKSRQ